ncbi:hypothetical protein [Paractinoplanes toevensis]|uniref:Uncharacterized protein n=1 Tax=Paractinoplanes toevensis TaxID=571911 RepID=A0A919VYQ9_9ACTN|nr:hypothetical protein [Actinoplanes toevensis]GIM89297.1 hypothetical protein Ato02nite_010900 [Actinoplanes toevensis]
MATGTVILSPGAAILPDGSASNAAPAMQRVKSSATAPGIYFLQLAFDASTEEWCSFQFRMPADYASAPVAVVQWKAASATSGGAVWDVRVSAVTTGDSVDVDAKGFGSANTATGTAPATAGYLVDTSVTLTNADSLAAGDFVVVRLARAAADGSDTATGDAECVGLAITYVTT